MNSTPSNSTWTLPQWMRPWEQFWFTPADPTVLALMRATCGALITYTLFVYGFTLQEFMGEHAVQDMILRMDTLREKPILVTPLSGAEYERAPNPKDEFQLRYYNEYRLTWGYPPPAPYPSDLDEVAYLNLFQTTYNVDMRLYGLPIPKTAAQKAYVEAYAKKWRVPPPAFPKSEAEAREIDGYFARQGYDPRRLYAIGTPEWSIWFHVLDPKAMMIVHSVFVVVALLFTFGFCTRITAAITWFANLCYIHRSPQILFGADTMFTIVLLYLMISPSGDAFSLDRVIRRWWSKAKPGFVQGWYRFWGKPIPSIDEIAPVAFSENPLPSVSANLAIRLLQIHLCFIYLMAGLSKLLGAAWWNGTAIWGTIANFELAPMQYEWYLDFLRFLGQYPLAGGIFLTGGCYFTLIFEIGYAFAIWRTSLRWIYLAAALLLHGLIGVFMGLSTFALIMVVMNMAFLRKNEAIWLLSWIGLKTSTTAAAATRPEPALAGAKG